MLVQLLCFIQYVFIFLKQYFIIFKFKIQLELIKIRWQVYESASFKNLKILSNSNPNKTAPSYRPNYKSLLDTFSRVFKTENGIRGLYRGFMINTMASGSAWGM